MNRRTTPSAPPLAFVAVLVVILFLVGRLAWQWVTAPDPEPRASLAEQVESIPGVVSVETGSARVPGGGGFRSTQSTVLFDQQILDDPQGSAERLGAVSTGWGQSHWSIDGLGSTAGVHYLSQVDPAPFAWWLHGVAALRDAEPTADLTCDIRLGSLDCEVTGGDPEDAREALDGVDRTDVRAWVEQARPDPDQPHGFALRVGGQQIREDPSSGPG